MEAADHVRVTTKSIADQPGGIESIEAGAKDYRTHLDIEYLLPHIMNDGIGLTHGDALEAF